MYLRRLSKLVGAHTALKDAAVRSRPHRDGRAACRRSFVPEPVCCWRSWGGGLASGADAVIAMSDSNMPVDSVRHRSLISTLLSGGPSQMA